jgi:hypothetical protein
MTLKNHQNIIIKINNIQDNINLNKEENTNFNPFFNQNYFSSPKNNFNDNILNNKLQCKNIDFPNQTNTSSQNLFQTNIPPHQIISNLNFSFFNNLNTSTDLKEDSSLKGNNESLYKNNYLNKNDIQNNNNKLIKPMFYNEPNTFQKENIQLNKALIQINQGRIKLKESAKFKKRNIFNKFKVYHIEPKKIKDKLSYKQRHKRKYKPDDIRKKIKARFHKSIKNIVNENLRQAGSKYLFSFLPQIFISSISRDKNHQVLNISYRDLIKKDFISNIDDNKYKNKNVDLVKYKNNLKVLEYLDQNPDICERSGFDIISKMKYGDLLEEYFKSYEFEKAINKLREENEEEDYIKEYVNKAKTYVKFFSEIPFKINKKKIIKKNKDIAIEIDDKEKEKIKKINN